jgi:hypothetical protein
VPMPHVSLGPLFGLASSRLLSLQVYWIPSIHVAGVKVGLLPEAESELVAGLHTAWLECPLAYDRLMNLGWRHKMALGPLDSTDPSPGPGAAGVVRCTGGRRTVS